MTLVLAAQLDLGLGERRRGGGGVIFSDTERGLFTLTLSERRGRGGVVFTDTSFLGWAREEEGVGLFY